MKIKHTPGEWVSSGYRVDVDVADGLSGICEMSDWMDESEMEANAKLIAAAPELLDACITLIQQAEVCNYQTSDGLHQLLDNLAIKEIRKAIKKATE